MVLWEIIPTCEDAMSCYTLCALTIMTSLGVLVVTVCTRWVSNGFQKVEKRIDKLECSISEHDNYIDRTGEIINQIHIDLAVQESSQADIKADIAEIKTLILNINKTLMEMK